MQHIRCWLAKSQLRPHEGTSGLLVLVPVSHVTASWGFAVLHDPLLPSWSTPCGLRGTWGKAAHQVLACPDSSEAPGGALPWPGGACASIMYYSLSRSQWCMSLEAALVVHALRRSGSRPPCMASFSWGCKAAPVGLLLQFTIKQCKQAYNQIAAEFQSMGGSVLLSDLGPLALPAPIGAARLLQQGCATVGLLRCGHPAS